MEDRRYRRAGLTLARAATHLTVLVGGLWTLMELQSGITLSFDGASTGRSGWGGPFGAGELPLSRAIALTLAAAALGTAAAVMSESRRSRVLGASIAFVLLAPFARNGWALLETAWQGGPQPPEEVGLTSAAIAALSATALCVGAEFSPPVGRVLALLGRLRRGLARKRLRQRRRRDALRTPPRGERTGSPHRSRNHRQPRLS